VDDVRLADFIETNTEPILAEWVTFAESCGPAAHAMDRAELRDHALAMLKVMIVDLRTPQTPAEQTSKSKGESDADGAGGETAAEVHGSGRAGSGFTVGEMVSEYRALRASVIRLWTKAYGTLVGDDLNDLLRFNEAIDQAIAESIARYTIDLDRSKETFLAVLGHDLRTPIGAIITSTQFMLDTGELLEPHLTLTTRMARSAKRMNKMVGDLLDFTRTQFGGGIPIVRGEMDLGREARDAVDEIKAAYPESKVQLNVSGDLTGNWDCARLSQVLANLLGNAVQHGAPKSMISVTVRGENKEVVLQVHNNGLPIPADEIPGLFSPFKRLAAGDAPRPALASLGLGLYIVEQIVSAHGGTITVDSDTRGTYFTVRLPR
jgi:signal transduction histidine kinase